MKNLFRKIAITLTLVMTFALCFTFVGCGDSALKDCYLCNNGADLDETYYWKDEVSTTAT